MNLSPGSSNTRGFVIAAVMMLISSTLVLTAQAPSGAVSGALRDSSGGALPGATVTLIDEQSKAEQTTVSGGDGLYAFSALPPGAYLVRATLEGFAPFEQKVTVAAAPVVVNVRYRSRR